MMDITVTANPGPAEDDTVGSDLCAVSDSDVTLDKGARPDGNLCSELGFRIDDGGWMNFIQHVLLQCDSY